MMKNKYSLFPRQYLMIISLTHWANIPNIVAFKHPEVPDRNEVQKKLTFVIIKTFSSKYKLTHPYLPLSALCFSPSWNELILTHFLKQNAVPFIYQQEL